MKPKLLLCLALFSISFFNSSAQPGPQYVESLDAMVVKAPLIVRGYFSADTRTFSSREGLFKYTLTVHVDEVLKGHPQNPVELTVDVYDSVTNEVQQWIGRQTPFLYFINTNNFTLPPFPRQLVRLDGTLNRFSRFSIQPPITLMDSTKLTNSADILAYTRKIAKQRLNSTNTFWLGGGWYSWRGSIDYLEVPVTPALEQMGKQLVRSNDWQSREEGIKVLGCFKSAKNVQLLKPFLNDSNYVDSTSVVWLHWRIYYPRKAAYDVLTNWGINVPEPVWNEDLPWHYDPAVRHELKVPIHSALTAEYSRWSSAGDDISAYGKEGYWTNVLVGSNMITGARCEWFVYPDGQPKPSKPIDVWQAYWPRLDLNSLSLYKKKADVFPVVGQKYIIEVNYTLFETDNAPTNRDNSGEIRTDIWRPQDGKNYRVLVEQILRTTFGP